MKARIGDAVAASLLSVGAVTSAGLAFAVQAALARSLSPSEYGRYAAALAIVTIVAPAVGFGVPAFWLKAYGTEGWTAIRWIKPSLRVVTRSALVCVGVVVMWAWFGVADARESHLLLWMFPAVLAQGAIEMASAQLQLEDKFARVALWQAVQHAARLALILVCWRLDASSDVVAAGFGLIGAMVTFGAWRSIAPLRHGNAALVGHGQRPLDADTSLSVPSTSELWRNAMPFGFSSLLFFAYAQSGVVIVSHFGAPQDAGSYGIAVTVLGALYLLPTVLFQKLLMPRFHRWSASGNERIARAYSAANKWLFASGVVVAGVAALIAPVALPFVFGRQYAQSVSVVTLMMLSTPFRFLTINASSVMTTRNLIRVRNRCAAAALIFSIVAGIVGVCHAGIAGAALASVAGEIVWAGLSVICVRHFLVDAPRETVRADSAVLAGESIAVSVIIPCFNCVDTVERAVASVFHQTCRPNQLILVDDVSTDGTRALLDGLAQTYPPNWIHVIVQPRNAGPGAARNVGWAAATQPYIAFLDSDDSWHPQKMALQYGWMHAHPDVAITGHPVAQLDSAEHVAAQPRPCFIAPRRVSRARVLFSNRFTPSSILLRANVRARFDETKRHAEDYFMLLDLVLMGEGAAYLFPLSLSYVYKAQFGAQSGLSSQLWKIQKGEQHNYLFFRKKGLISYVEWLSFSLLSACKYVRRCVLSRRFR